MCTINRATNTITCNDGQTYPLSADWLQTYLYCRVCKKQLADETAEYAVKRLETMVCGSECQRQEQLKRYACCDKATPTFCVCAYSFTCPEHGERHIGTHD